MVKQGILHTCKLLLGTLLILCVSCQKAPINGHLDGRWQILEIEIDKELSNVKDQQLYYNFYLHVCNLSSYGEQYEFAEANLHYEDDIIYLDFPYVDTLDQTEYLQQFGIYSNPVVFEVEYIDKKKLIIKEGDNIIITLRKF